MYVGCSCEIEFIPIHELLHVIAIHVLLVCEIESLPIPFSLYVRLSRVSLFRTANHRRVLTIF